MRLYVNGNIIDNSDSRRDDVGDKGGRFYVYVTYVTTLMTDWVEFEIRIQR